MEMRAGQTVVVHLGTEMRCVWERVYGKEYTGLTVNKNRRFRVGVRLVP
jgi:hypothetical protein